MSLATDLQDDIAELLDDPDTGRAITISRQLPGTYDPATGATSGAPAPTTFTTRGLFLGYHDKLIDGTLIKRGDRRCFIKLKGLRYTAAAGDEVTAGADKYGVIDFKTIELGGTDIIFILQVRR